MVAKAMAQMGSGKKLMALLHFGVSLFLLDLLVFVVLLVIIFFFCVGIAGYWKKA